MCLSIPIKRVLDKAYIERLSSFELWPKTYIIDPKSMAAAGFVNTKVASDEVRCLDCNIGFNEWEEKDNPIELHAKHSPNCLFVKHFPDGYRVSDDDIVDYWLLSSVVQTYFQACDYSVPVVKAGLKQRLETKFKNFSNLREIHLYFKNKNPIKSYDVCGAMDRQLAHSVYEPDVVCKICREKKVDTVFVNCGHSIACKSCADNLITCRVCFHFIKKVQQIVKF
jgi:hypothetical protein